SGLGGKQGFEMLGRYRRPLLLRLEHTHRPALEDYVHRATRLGSSRSLNLRIVSDSLSSPTTGEGGNHGCEGDFGKEVCCEAERGGRRTAWNVDSERKEPGAPGAEGADLVEGRCLGSWQREARQPDHRSSGNQPIHGLSGAQTTGERRLRGSVEPQAARDAFHYSDFWLREGGQADCLGLCEAAKRTRTLDFAVVGEQGRRPGHGRWC